MAYYARLGITIKRLLTDNGAAFRSNAFARACAALHITHRFTKPYCPQTNGKAERFIQSTMREWAYGFVYDHSNQRTAMLDYWTHHYNWHRPRQALAVCRQFPAFVQTTYCNSTVRLLFIIP